MQSLSLVSDFGVSVWVKQRDGSATNEENKVR